MSNPSTFYRDNVTTSSDMEAWFCMLNSMVNFLSASSTLAAQLERNYLVDSVTTLQTPTVPLLTAPPKIEAITNGENNAVRDSTVKFENNNGVRAVPNIKDNAFGNITAVEVPLFLNQSSINTIQSNVENISESVSFEVPLVLNKNYTLRSSLVSECLGEGNDLPQEVRYVDTQDMGDCASSNSPEEDTTYSYEDEQEEDALSSADNADPIEETIKICDSEDVCYFDEYSDSEETIDSSNSQKLYEEITNIQNIEIETEDKEVIAIAVNLSKDKSVQAKPKDSEYLLRNTSKTKAKSNKSEEIQTKPTSRYKSTIRALITKSPELQQPIKECIARHHASINKKVERNIVIFREKPPCKNVPKNLNELKEQLDSFKKSSTSKITNSDCKTESQNCSKIPLEKNIPYKSRKTAKELTNTPNASSCSKHIPLKSPGTTKQFASVESVVKKMINGTKITEKQKSNNKEELKMCCPKPKANGKQTQQDKPEERKSFIPKPYNNKYQDFKIVKNHQDFLYKKTIVQRPPDKIKTPCQSRPCSKEGRSIKVVEETKKVPMKYARHKSMM